MIPSEADISPSFTDHDVVDLIKRSLSVSRSSTDSVAGPVLAQCAADE